MYHPFCDGIEALFFAKTYLTDAGYLQTGRTWVKSHVACHMHVNGQVALSLCIRGRVMEEVGVPPKKVG